MWNQKLECECEKEFDLETHLESLTILFFSMTTKMLP